jgi:hypothetical protein
MGGQDWPKAIRALEDVEELIKTEMVLIYVFLELQWIKEPE